MFSFLRTSCSLSTGTFSVVCNAAEAPSSSEVEICNSASFICLCLVARTRTCYFYDEIFEKL
jgi:hypothetical protein